ncbi:uncharacterized protein LOC117894970 isoform X2 [Drosophila subobscura]|uniref:uncharacterized protein LOC117894970 isoform X2 n=1 Tax=Drosophila subobscura TaxID=7241 RepID=UPI00155A8D5B|nr:uncharacterized protein LOC117894970 isoform X2 [Drosophila subobscura]
MAEKEPNGSDSSDMDNNSFHSLCESLSSSDSLDASSTCGSDCDGDDGPQNPEEQQCAHSSSSSSGVSNTMQSFSCTNITDHETSMDNADETSIVETPKQKKSKKVSIWHPGAGNSGTRKLPPVPYVLPSMEAFSLDRPTATLNERVVAGTSRKSEAMHKMLYTGNWVDSQKFNKFDLVVNAYQKYKSGKKNESAAATVDQPKETSNEQVVSPNQQSKPEPVEEEYVSPFKNMPLEERPKESPLLAGLKKPIVLPAGYDLSALQVIKNPNHWSLRPGVRTGDRIY